MTTLQDCDLDLVALMDELRAADGIPCGPAGQSAEEREMVREDRDREACS